MTLYLTIYDSDHGRALPNGYRAEMPDGSQDAEMEARLTLLGLAMESLGYEVSFTGRRPSGRAAPALGFEVVE